ncbi:MAG: helix-hairpin-helix domain-containing protein [Candidatus Eisenbacteria bacterium]
MTAEERRLVIAVAVLVLLGSGIRWFGFRPVEAPSTAERAGPSDSLAASEGQAEESAAPDSGFVRIDLNRDDARSLEALPGIGPAKARRIVEWREANGPFRSLGDLERVPGIGRKTIKRIAPFVTPAGEAQGAGLPAGAEPRPRPEDRARNGRKGR